jgi:hypothetical protein
MVLIHGRARPPAFDTVKPARVGLTGSCDRGRIERITGDHMVSIDHGPSRGGAMKYACLVYLVEKEMQALSASEALAWTDESLAYDAALRRSGHLLAAQALQPIETATTVRVRGGKLSTTDGPFAETKEQLGGFLLIEARDLNDAIQVAAKIPLARRGCIEVRPVKEIKP